MSDIAIKFENVSKQYRLGLVSTQTLSHDLNRWWQTTILRKEDPYLKVGEINDRSQKGESEYVWALRDINFDVQKGEVLGIIGRNGAGKSTLLKILSRVTSPTTGMIKAQGRIASLLEVGTGFHPELTGRENIYMNGSIMGMSRQEITRKLDEIVEFAGVARYLDTPTKRYSSGMTVRLGFSIAAHLEPEILVVDEVLAVGDAEFQKKAVGKMQDVSRGEGRTVLFVSHNMASIKSLCTKGVLLKNGSVEYAGDIIETVDYYIRGSYVKNPEIFYDDISMAPGNHNIRIKSFEVFPTDEGSSITVESGITFELLFYNYKSNIMLDSTFELSTNDDVIIFHIGKVLTPEKESEEGYYKVQFDLPPYLLNAGKYKMKLIFGENQTYPLFIKEEVLSFEVENTLTGQGYNMSIMPGVIKPKIEIAHSFNKYYGK